MHFACSNTSSGIPLSGIAIISCNTLVAFSSRSVASSRADPAQHSVPRLNIASKNITLFIEQPHFCHSQGDKPSGVAGKFFLLRRNQLRSLAPAILYKMDHFRQPSNPVSSQAGFSRPSSAWRPWFLDICVVSHIGLAATFYPL
jgi:hypothetical protein